MDTDELSIEAYEGVLVEAEKFNHELALQFGLLSDDCDSEAVYLVEVKLLIEEIIKMDKAGIEDLFLGSPPSKTELNKVLDKILANIIALEKIPEDKRQYDF